MLYFQTANRYPGIWLMHLFWKYQSDSA